MKVLIAEDDRVTGELLARALQRWSYETIVVGDGAQAWEYLRSASEPTLAVLVVHLVPGRRHGRDHGDRPASNR